MEEMEKERETFSARSRARQEEIVGQMETLLSSLKEMHTQALDQINTQWEEILSSLEETAPDDLADKVELIAREVSEIEEL